METLPTIFAQLLAFLPRYEFGRCVERYGGHHKVQSFSCWDQYLAMAFAQLTYRESLRDIEACLGAMRSKLYHVGFRSRVTRSTLAYANDTRDWRIYADFAHILIAEAQKLYADSPMAVDLANTVYALDSTTIDLCLAIFPWARFRRRKGAIKLHTLLDLRGNIPSFIVITTGKVHDVNVLDELPLEAGAIYVMDRGYLDFTRLFRMHQAGAFFVTRTKRKVRFVRQLSLPFDPNTGVISDQLVSLAGDNTALAYPDQLRRVHFFDAKHQRHLVFLTNEMTLPAATIAGIYKCRWQVELFFKWIKQHLRIKRFFGTSENAVKCQVWIAVSVYVLVAIAKQNLKLPQSLYQILQVASVSLFENVSILQALGHAGSHNEPPLPANQLDLFS